MSCVVYTDIAGRKESTAMVFQVGGERFSLFSFSSPFYVELGGRGCIRQDFG